MNVYRDGMRFSVSGWGWGGRGRGGGTKHSEDGRINLRGNKFSCVYILEELSNVQKQT